VELPLVNWRSCCNRCLLSARYGGNDHGGDDGDSDGGDVGGGGDG
jgi:hypothetical protein